jgi:hypothetical protein
LFTAKIFPERREVLNPAGILLTQLYQKLRGMLLFLGSDITCQWGDESALKPVFKELLKEAGPWKREL